MVRWVERKGACGCCKKKESCCSESPPELLFVTVLGATGEAAPFNGTHEVPFVVFSNPDCNYRLELGDGYEIVCSISDKTGSYYCNVSLRGPHNGLMTYPHADYRMPQGSTSGMKCGDLLETPLQPFSKGSGFPPSILVSE